MKTQTPVHGGRGRLSSSVVKELRRAVDAEARRYGVSRSFVVAVAVGDALGVDVEQYRVKRYDAPKKTLLQRVK